MLRGWRVYSIVKKPGRGPRRYVLSGVRGIAPSEEAARCGNSATRCYFDDGKQGRDARGRFTSYDNVPGRSCHCGYHLVRKADDVRLALGWSLSSWDTLVTSFSGISHGTSERRVRFVDSTAMLDGTSVGVAVVSVLAWGKVIPHARGWRARYVRPEHVQEVRPAAWWDEDEAKLIADLRRSLPDVTVADNVVRFEHEVRRVWGVMFEGNFYPAPKSGQPTMMCGDRELVCRMWASIDGGRSWLST